ncbi:hypothetical protein LX77_00427 [Gelidibacter algens]|uniref:Uncharacterized protein n=1 Tax=Gelidibacter algens TaxID=49280 RepID=A0A1A7R273_9FLAO|nr:hypothetical protein [Gelidibacter algens]OBX25603.1 hypothetical protein A9996_09195 [Gelidibacter algens]RAJ27853.1 hypothetical protein LX77_00427 [Gelidibacter algens]
MIATIAHKITAFVLVFILFAHNINTLVIIGDFMVNQAIIAKNLCVQKDNQQGCNGKCQLTKQIKQSTPDSNTDLPAQETRRMSLDAFCLFETELTEAQNEIIARVQNLPFEYTQRIILRYQDIETPPPNFS